MTFVGKTFLNIVQKHIRNYSILKLKYKTFERQNILELKRNISIRKSISQEALKMSYSFFIISVAINELFTYKLGVRPRILLNVHFAGNKNAV